jgi:uncharacterized protein (DUF1810 family)
LTGDPHDLARFVLAQQGTYERALAEIANGDKRSHWMWYVFPQLAGLGASATSRKYAIKSLAEAQAYLRHEILGPRLVACAEAALAVEGRSALQIFGSTDELKLRSSATLFTQIAPSGSVFHRLLDKCFAGQADEATLQILRTHAASAASSARTSP